MTERNAGGARRLRGRRTVVAAMAMGLAATGSIVVATEAPAINPTVRPAVKRPVLQIGSTGADVTAVQARLGVSQTGYFGVLTAAAVTNFQRSNGITASGKVGATTWAKLMRAVSAAASTSARPVLQMGSTGPAVSDLQRRLPMPMVTGYFGTMTDAYVRALQKKAKLKVNGIVGKKTWKKVGKVKVKVKTVSSAPAPAAAKPSAGLAAQVMAIAASYKGVPYVATGYTPAQGFNCSSYTQWVYQRAGIDLGGAYTVTQYSRARKITKTEAKPGDLVFFYNYPNNFIGHVGIYAGNGMMWHAPRTGRVVSLDQVYSSKVLYARVL